MDVLQGTLDLLVLKALAVGPLHGWAISKRIRDMSRDALTVVEEASATTVIDDGARRATHADLSRRQ